MFISNLFRVRVKSKSKPYVKPPLLCAAARTEKTMCGIALIVSGIRIDTSSLPLDSTSSTRKTEKVSPTLTLWNQQKYSEAFGYNDSYHFLLSATVVVLFGWSQSSSAEKRPRWRVLQETSSPVRGKPNFILLRWWRVIFGTRQCRWHPHREASFLRCSLAAQGN